MAERGERERYDGKVEGRNKKERYGAGKEYGGAGLIGYKTDR